jgi:hypothetical protein
MTPRVPQNFSPEGPILPHARRVRRLIGAGHGFVMAAGAALVARAHAAGTPELLRQWTREGGPVETAGALVLLIVAGYGLFRLVAHPPPGRAETFGLWGLTVAAFLAAMEEISWGQHVWGFASPDFFLRHNRQRETNLHNLAPAELFGLATNIAVYAAFVFGPVLLHWVRPAAGPISRLKSLAPSVHNVLMFLAAMAFQAYFLWETAADTAAFCAGLVAAALLIRRVTPPPRLGWWLHWGLVAGCGGLFMACHRVFGYHNLQYEIRELIIAYSIFFWMAGWPAARRGASAPSPAVGRVRRG